MVFSLDEAPSGATINPDTGEFEWTSSDGEMVVSVTVRVTDDGTPVLSETETFIITVNNIAPELVISGAETVLEDELYTLSISASDPGADTITEWEINWGDESIGTLPGSSTEATHTYLNPDTYTISATATDEDGTYNANTLTLMVEQKNKPPVAMDDAITTREDTPVTITASSLLSNDKDPDTGDTLTINSIDTTGTLGTVTDNGDGTFTYSPNGQFDYLMLGEYATDSFTYTVTDGNGGTDTAKVTVTVKGTEVTFMGYPVQSYGNSQDEDASQYEILDVDTTTNIGTTLHLWGNNWKATELPYSYKVTQDTVIEFDFLSEGEDAEINGIGLDEDAILSTNALFQIGGTQTSTAANQDYNTYSGNEWMHFVIPVGEFYTGIKQYLFFANDADAGQATSVYYRNIKVYEKDVVDFNEYAIQSYGGSQDEDASQYEILDVGIGENVGTTLNLWGNNWKAIILPYSYEVTQDTVIEFDFLSEGENAEINGIGLDTDDVLSTNALFQIGGTQTSSAANQDYNTYSGNDWMHFVIPVGEFYTGIKQYLFFANDADAGQATSVYYRNIRIY